MLRFVMLSLACRTTSTVSETDSRTGGILDQRSDSRLSPSSSDAQGAPVDEAGLAQALEGNGPFTLFAPTNDAFAAADLSACLKAIPEALTSLLRYHLLSSQQDSAARSPRAQRSPPTKARRSPWRLAG